jgi:hypothetical protein
MAMPTEPWSLPYLPGETALSHCEREIFAMAVWHRDHGRTLAEIGMNARLASSSDDPAAAYRYAARAIAALKSGAIFHPAE